MGDGYTLQALYPSPRPSPVSVFALAAAMTETSSSAMSTFRAMAAAKALAQKMRIRCRSAIGRTYFWYVPVRRRPLEALEDQHLQWKGLWAVSDMDARKALSHGRSTACVKERTLITVWNSSQ